MTVKAMLASMDSAEISEWIAFLQHEEELQRERKAEKVKTPNQLSNQIMARFGGKT